MNCVWSVAVACAIVAAVGGSGCTVIGAGVGLAIDHARARVSDIPSSSLPHLESDQAVEVTLDTGEVVKGFYRGVSLMDSTRYGMRFEAVHPPGLPALGDSVRLRLNLGQEVSGRFAGLDPGAILVECEGTIGTHDLHFIESMSAAATPALSDDALRTLERGGPWPMRSRILLAPPYASGGSTTARVPLDDVESIQITQRSHLGVQACALGGLAVDVFWISFIRSLGPGPALN